MRVLWKCLIFKHTHSEIFFVFVLCSLFMLANIMLFCQCFSVSASFRIFIWSGPHTQTPSHPSIHPWHYGSTLTFRHILTNQLQCVYLWFEMEPIEAIWWIITCAFDELCNIRHKRSHAESEAPQYHPPANSRARENDENTWAHFASVFSLLSYFLFLLFFSFLLLHLNVMYVMHCGVKWNAQLVAGVYFQTVEKLNGKCQPKRQQQHGVTKQQQQRHQHQHRATAPSYITLKSSIPSISLWLVPIHTLFRTRARTHSHLFHSLACVYARARIFPAFLFVSLENLLKRFIAKILSQHIFLRLSTLWLQIIFGKCTTMVLCK